MKRNRSTLWVPLLGLLLLGSCGVSKKKRTYSESRSVSVAGSPEIVNRELPEENEIELPSPAVSIADNIVRTALTFSGTRYKFGGSTKKGMDCSGLLYVSFKEHDIELPRVSHYMAEAGKKIRVDKVSKGDLLFFRTNNRRRRINHVGLVVDVNGDEIKFIHSTTSRGVIVSSLKEGYWNYAFVKATRVLTDVTP